MENLCNKKFETIVNTYSQELKQLAWKYIMDPYLVEDIVQEVLLKCFIHLEQLEDLRSIKAWLFTLTKNQCKDYLRTKYHQNVFQTSEFFIPNQATPESEMIFQQTSEEIYNQIRSLPEIYQEILYLTYVKEWKIKEIQQHLNLNVSTVKTRLFRARHLLKTAMNS